MRRALTSLIASDPGLEIVDTAKNGQEGVDKAKALKPDVVTLDIEMPVMDGITALKAIRRECLRPRPAVLVCSTLTSAGSQAAIRALCAGAADIILKDADATGHAGESMKSGLVAKIRAIAEQRMRMDPPMPVPGGSGVAAGGGGAPAMGNSRVDPANAPRPRLSARQFGVVMIGSSTGGPPVLEKVLTGLPANFPWPIVVAQHMPAMFTQSLAARLGELCKVKVVHGSDGLPLFPGMVAIIPGGQQGRVLAGSGGAGGVGGVGGVSGRFKLEVSSEPRSALYKPSVDELMASAAGLGQPTLGVILTGMGEDGKLGCAKLKQAGGTVLAQRGDTCVVYGMPRAVVEAGHVSAALTPEELTDVLANVGTAGVGTAARAA